MLVGSAKLTRERVKFPFGEVVNPLTYRFCGVADFAYWTILDHVIAKEPCREVVIGPDDAREARDAGNREKQVFNYFLSVESHYLNYLLIKMGKRK